jgi:cobyrinic acid a,c-diamide synthase
LSTKKSGIFLLTTNALHAPNQLENQRKIRRYPLNSISDNMLHSPPRLVIAGLRGASGKTMLSIGLISQWRRMGYRVAPFKKGPDFIDPGWLTLAAGSSCHNLDPFLMTEDQILESFLTHSQGARLSLIEGNRGLFDGLDVDGSFSTAELAKMLHTPVILIVDVTMATRTVAAIVKGCQAFDPGLPIAGIVLNRVAGARQQSLIGHAIEKYCGLAVVGAVPKLSQDIFPERHMGLVPHQERDHANRAISWARRIAKDHLDMETIWDAAGRAPALERSIEKVKPKPGPADRLPSPKIGIIRDRSFWFYYPENLEHLQRLGAQLVEIDALNQTELPPLDGLYIGGGFPETQARKLAENELFRKLLQREIEKGLPVYAECGGFMYLGERLLVDGVAYPMVGALPVEFILDKKPQGHGYTVLSVDRPNPYFRPGDTLKGHEFHYSKASLTHRNGVRFVFKVRRGGGIEEGWDGICRKNVLATYSHVHAGGKPDWAEGLVRAARAYQKNARGREKSKKNI